MFKILQMKESLMMISICFRLL